MINKFIWFLIVIILLLSVRPALSQPIPVNGYAVQHFTDENGLPQNSINDLLFDKNGYLWLATQVGLVRYDGSSFQLYYPNDKPAMESNIALLGKDDKGSVYFQTTDHQLYRYQGNNSRRLSPLSTSDSPRFLLLNAQSRLFDFSTFLNNAPTLAEHKEREAIYADLMVHNENFYVTDAGYIYFHYHDSLYYYDGSLTRLNRLPASDCRFFTTGSRLFVLNRDKPLAVFDDGKAAGHDLPIEFDPRQTIPANIPADQFHIFSCGRVNHLLAGHLLYRLFPEANGHIRASFLLDLSFIPNISSVEYNPGLDLLLIATNTEGFYFLRRNRFTMSGWSDDLKEKMRHHLFGPMTLLHDSAILTDKFVFTPAGGFSWVKDHGPIWQRCLYIDRKQRIWAAHDSVPVLQSITGPSLAAGPSLDGNIQDYTEDSAGQLYCLTERSLYRVGEDLTFHRLDAAIPSSTGTQLNEVVRYVRPHRLWIGHTNGLIEYDPDKNEAHTIPPLAGSHVRAIHCCTDGSILVGTYGQGYFYYDQEKFHRMPLDKNGFLMTAHCFLEDKKGNVWIPCNKGLFKTPKADMDAFVKGQSSQLYYYYYGRQDGLLTNEFNGGFNRPGIILPSGFIALLSMKGMVCFYADSLQTDFPHGAIDMTELDIDGTSTRRTDTIKLAAGYNSLIVKIASPYLGNRNNLYLQYKLDGLPEDWSPLDENGELNLSRLPPGNYTLRVRKVNGFGKNNYEYRQWSIVVPPVFYRTTWFLIAVGVLVLFLVSLLILLRLKLVEKKKEMQSTVVRLEETVTMLRHSEQALLKTSRQREKLISLVIHDLRSPLRFLTMLAGDLHDNQDGFTPAERKDRAFWVKKGAQDIYNFSEDFLLWVTAQKDNFKVSKKLIYIRPLLQEMHDFYLEQALQKGNKLSYEADEDLQVWSDPHLLITIIRNLTDNANKYTEQGVIRISARRDNDELLITVADTGKGMSRAQVAAFLGQENLDNVKSGSQLGHKFVFDLTQRLNGALSVESGENCGTTVSVRIPMETPPAPKGEWSH